MQCMHVRPHLLLLREAPVEQRVAVRGQEAEVEERGVRLGVVVCPFDRLFDCLIYLLVGGA